jgi:hypothetical protein
LAKHKLCEVNFETLGDAQPKFKEKTKSNSNNLANQLDIYLILAKQENLASNSLRNQLGKNRNLTKLTSPCAYMRADRGCHGRFPAGGRVKKEIKNREGFLM